MITLYLYIIGYIQHLSVLASHNIMCMGLAVMLVMQQVLPIFNTLQLWPPAYLQHTPANRGIISANLHMGYSGN